MLSQSHNKHPNVPPPHDDGEVPPLHDDVPLPHGEVSPPHGQVDVPAPYGEVPPPHNGMCNIPNAGGFDTNPLP